MPRRRMIDPGFWDNTEVAKLTRDERLLVLGCLNNADDEGRLKAHPAYLKAAIFMYDNDLDPTQIDELKQSTLAKMVNWHKENPWRMQLYQNAGEDYLHFPNWFDQQKPSHPTPSKLPTPTPENSGEAQEKLPKESSITPPQSSIGQSSQVKYSIGQVREVQEDFTEFLDSEKDLTDLLTTTLEKYISAGRERVLASGATELTQGEEEGVKANWGIVVLKKCWKDGVGEDIPGPIFQGAHQALRQYPLEVMAKAFAKGVRYKGGKHKSWKYMQAIIDEEMERRKGRASRGPP